MTYLSNHALRQANIDRAGAWHQKSGKPVPWTKCDWAIALGGEVGEMLNVVKKLNRSRDGIKGNTVTDTQLLFDLGLEIADCIIYHDLIADQFQIAPGIMPTFELWSANSIACPYYGKSESVIGASLQKWSGKLAEYAIEADEKTDARQSRFERVVYALREIKLALLALSIRYHVNPSETTVYKFNQTSAQNCLGVTMGPASYHA